MLYIHVCGLQPQTMAATRVCLRHMQSGEFWLHATLVHTLYTCAGCHPRQPRQLVCAFGTCKAANLAARHSCSYFIYVCGLQPQTMAATRVCLRHMQSDEFGWLPPLFILCIRVRIATPDNRGNRCVPSAHAKRRIWLHAPINALYTCAGCNPRRWRQPVCAFGTCKAANLAARPH